MKFNSNIIENSYYMISLFHNQNKDITNLQLQKLMYFTECFFMALTDSDYLYDEECLAWTYGPVYKILYNRFKEFSKNDIIISDEQVAIGERLPEINRHFIEAIYTQFGNFSSAYLVGLTHQENSPWDRVNKLKEEIEIANMNLPISKIESSVWFRKNFIDILEESK